MSRGCQALGRWGQLRLRADLGLLGACFRSKPGGLRCRSRARTTVYALRWPSSRLGFGLMFPILVATQNR